MEMELENIFEKYELTREQYETFRDKFSLKQLRAGDTVLSEGGLAETFYFIRSGELTASRLSSARQEYVLKVLGPGELFGEVGLIQDVPRIATIKAITDAQLYELSKADFFDLLDSNPAFSALLDRLHTLRLLQGVPVFRKLDDQALDITLSAGPHITVKNKLSAVEYAKLVAVDFALKNTHLFVGGTIGGIIGLLRGRRPANQLPR